jgi:hypothetical protein
LAKVYTSAKTIAVPGAGRLSDVVSFIDLAGLIPAAKVFVIGNFENLGVQLGWLARKFS